MMPYNNFDDTGSFCSSYHISRQENADMNIGEFIFNKVLAIEGLFDEAEEDDIPDISRSQPPVPLKIQPVQSGLLYCNKIIMNEQEKEVVPAKPTCLFKENKFSFDFQVSVFHPPAMTLFIGNNCFVTT